MKYLINKNTNFISLLIIVGAFFLFVFPNSFRLFKLPMILGIFLYTIDYVYKLDKKVVLSLLLSYIVTIVYILVGLRNSRMPEVAALQVIIVYIFTPLLWSVIVTYILERYTLITITNYLIAYSIFASISIYISIYLYNTSYAYLLEYIIDNPNLNFTEDGIVELKLFVYGSLIFFIPATLQLENFFQKKWKFFLMIFIGFITALISGRSALLLAFFIGIFFYILNNISIRLIQYFIIGIILFVISVFTLDTFGVNIFNIFFEFTNKILGVSDGARPEQTIALIDGIDNNILGAGHGVGVDYLRSSKFPWRYENLPFATIYRVSFVGFAIYSIPFIYSIYKFININKRNSFDNYMMAGYFSMLVATFTNPYLESFEFNIFYVLPFIYFINRKILQ